MSVPVSPPGTLAVVTGAARSIGRAIAERLVKAPVVYVVHLPAVVGRSGAVDWAVVVGVDGDESAETIAQAVTFTLTTRTAAGQVVMLGNQHLGAMLP